MAEGLDGKLTFNKKGQRLLQFTTPKGGRGAPARHGERQAH